jgi:hypothetical protein
MMSIKTRLFSVAAGAVVFEMTAGAFLPPPPVDMSQADDIPLQAPLSTGNVSFATASLSGSILMNSSLIAVNDAVFDTMLGGHHVVTPPSKSDVEQG